MDIVITLILLAAIVVGLRQWLLQRSGPPAPRFAFDGWVYRVGEAAIAERRCEQPQATVIAMHGFCESIGYFKDYYADPAIQLIAINSGDYHLPIESPRYREAAWAQVPTGQLGTIEYDAEVLLQALEQLPRSQRIRVHGHSRGGAVVLQAAAWRPELFRGVEVILEAPVLPQPQYRPPLPPALLWLLPLLLPLWRRQPVSRRNRALWGPLEAPAKRALIESLPFNCRRARTMVINIKDIADWVTGRSSEILGNLEGGTVLVPERDRILSPRRMRASAEAGGSALALVDVAATSHFVLLDRPEALPPLLPAPAAAVSA